ncbi:MAG: hypothetical protein K0Q78_2332 [Cellvibrio sp.]|jgi:hypothetical protein|nr:hypothetical protein [Cellvibrio sp.]
MTFDPHVFISYAHADNLEARGPGLITRFHEVLLPYLTQRLKRTNPNIWRDQRLSDNDIFDSKIEQNIRKSAVMLAMFTDNYVGSEWCKREVRVFGEAANASIGLTPNNKSRFFKIVLEPPEKIEGFPDFIHQSLGMQFFIRVDREFHETKDEKAIPMRLDPNFGAEIIERFNKKIAILAWEIAETLKAVEQVSHIDDGQVAKPCVYLARCDEDRLGDRITLQSELLQRGYHVLPDRELPHNQDELRQVVAEMLTRSIASIHLLGAGPGSILSGSKFDSDLVIQYELAVQRATVAPLQQLISLPKNSYSLREQHQKFLDGLRNDASILGNAQLIDGDLNKVTEEMLCILKTVEQRIQAKKNNMNPKSEASGSVDKKLKLYVIFTEADLATTGELRDFLEEYYDLQMPIFEGTPQEVREANQLSLTQSDKVLVYWGAGTDGWFASMMSEVEKAMAWRNGQPFGVVLQCIAAPATAIKQDKLRKVKTGVINALDILPLEPIKKLLNEGGL